MIRQLSIGKAWHCSLWKIALFLTKSLFTQDFLEAYIVGASAWLPFSSVGVLGTFDWKLPRVCRDQWWAKRRTLFNMRASLFIFCLG